MSIYTRFIREIDRRAKKVRDERFYGTLGRRNLDGTVTIAGSREGWVMVTLPGGTTTELPNTGNGHVPLRANLPVKMLRLHSGDLVLDGQDDRLLEGDPGGPGAYGVPPHAPTHEPGGSDEVHLDFIDLGDVPSDYAGQTGKVVKVNAAEDGLEFATEAGAAVVSVNGQTGVVVLDPDDLDDSATTHKFTTATEITKLAGIAAGAEVNVNADWLASSGDAFIANKPTIPTLPVKATGAEIDTGTDDAKFATPKAIEDSSYIKAAYADAKVTDAIADGVTTIAPSQNAVFDALATKQPLDATLTSIAGLGTAADKMLYTTGVDVWAELATLAYGRSLLGSTNIAAAQTILALVPGTNVQAQNANLAALAGLTGAANKLPYFTGAGAMTLANFTAFGITLAALADAAAGRTALGLGALALLNTVGTAQIDADSVTAAKMANMAVNTIRGRITAGTGDPEDLSATQVRTILNVADGANNYVHPNHTGDVTSTGDGATVIGVNKVLTAMIADAQVTLAKMANLAADTIIGRATGAGTGVPQALTKTQVLALLNVTDGANPTNATNIATAAHGATLDTSPLDADEVVGLDSSASFGLIRTTWTSIKAFLLTYFSGLFAVLLGTAGGQTLHGGTAANEKITIRGTTHASKTTSYVILQDTGGKVGIGTTTPTFLQHNVAASGANADFALDATAAGTAKYAAVFLQSDQGYIQFAGYGSTFPGTRYGQALAGSGEFLTVTLTKLLIGTLENTPIYFGTNNALRLAILGTGEVGIGGLTAVGASVLGVKAGASANDAAVGGVLYVDSGTHSNGGAIATDLATYTVPADTLSVNNQSLEFEAWGTFTNSVNSKSLKVNFGSDTWTIISGTSGATGVWVIRGRIVRTGAATQDVVIELNSSVGTPVTVSTATRTLSSSNVLKFVGQGGASTEISQEGFVVKWADSNT